MPAQPAQHPTLGISTGSLQDFDHFIAATGTHPEVLDVFEAWSRDRPLDPELAAAVRTRHANLSVTWEPWDPARSHTDQPDYSLASIIDGQHDPYIDMFARSVKALTSTVTIRLMHEMNGNWYPWGYHVNGNRDGEFVLAWRHVVDRFAALGVCNVTWLWAPNAVYSGSTPLRPLYPGDAYVDAVGVSNYNWGERDHDGFATRWSSFETLFDPSITQLQALTDRPIWIAEVGSSNNGGRKAAWLASMLEAVARRPEISGVIWFDHVDDQAGVDWRIETEPDATDAWRAGFVNRPVVTGNQPSGGCSDALPDHRRK